MVNTMTVAKTSKRKKPGPKPRPRPPKGPVGRPSLYKVGYARIAEALCKRGATDIELAEEFGVTTMTIARWSVQHEEFCCALRVGKDSYDDRVERSLAQRAVGYSYNSEKIFMPAGAKEPVRAKIIEHIPPDIGAAKLWLTNRRGSVWRDKVSQEITGKDGGPIETSDTTELENARRAAFMLGKAVAKQESLKSEDADAS